MSEFDDDNDDDDDDDDADDDDGGRSNCTWIFILYIYVPVPPFAPYPFLARRSPKRVLGPRPCPTYKKRLTLVIRLYFV